MRPNPAKDPLPAPLAVVIVTFNRCRDLEELLTRLLQMQTDFAHLVVIDNASNDATTSVLNSASEDFGDKLIIRRMQDNGGGAGGFHEGMKLALELPVDWIWMSDDDAIPRLDCFSRLLSSVESTKMAYGSTAVVKQSPDEELCWPARKSGSGHSITRCRPELEPLLEVDMLPFLGFMVSRELALQIGLPNKHYFISGDDMQYSIRLKQSSVRMFQVRDSVVDHPAIPRYAVNVIGRRIDCLVMPPWRRQLDIRNRIWNARLKGGVPGALYSTVVLAPRVLFTLLNESPRQGQIGAYLRGFWSGLFQYGRSGNLPNTGSQQS